MSQIMNVAGRPQLWPHLWSGIIVDYRHAASVPVDWSGRQWRYAQRSP